MASVIRISAAHKYPSVGGLCTLAAHTKACGIGATNKQPSNLCRLTSSTFSSANTQRSQALRRLVVKAASSSSSSDGRKQSRWDPLLENSDAGCPVPPEQQPVNEYSDLAETAFFAWGSMGPFNLSMRLGGLYLFFTLVFGWPISTATFDPETQALQCVVSAMAGGLFPIILATSRLYLGWNYIGDRLKSATVEYEETGWYDGQVWVKTPELLARDRLLASYRVNPVLKRLRTTLLGLVGGLASLTLVLLLLPPVYAPKPEPSPYPFEDLDENGMVVVNVIKAEELPMRSFSPEVAEAFERLHSPALPLEESEEDLEDVAEESQMMPASYSKSGYGFEYLVEGPSPSNREVLIIDVSGETEETLFTYRDASEAAQVLQGRADVVIFASVQGVVGESEDTMRPMGTGEIAAIGAGIRPGRETGVRISDHLGVGPGGELQMLRPVPAEQP